MTNDLVKRLHEEANLIYGSPPCGLLCEAADRIEQLEAELKICKQQIMLARRLAYRPKPEYPPEIGIPHLKED